MSTMYDVRVLARANDSIDLELRQSHPDYGIFPKTAFFALQLLLHRAYPSSLLAERIPQETYFAMCDFETGASLAASYVSSVEVLRAERVPFDRARALEALSAHLRADGLEEGADEWDDALDDAWNAMWKTSPPLVVLRVVVTEPKWIAHLEAGMTFDGAGWDLDGPYVA